VGEVVFAPDLLARSSDPEVGRLIAGERRLFETRRAGREGQKAQLKERVGQLNEQIQGLSEQIVAKGREIELIGQELVGVRELWRKNLVQITRVTALERDAARLEGERGGLISSIAQTKGKITETELQVIQIEQDLRTEVGKELADIRGKVAELVERKVTADDQLKRIELRAPQDGIVHQLAVHTVGGVIGPAEAVMLIVPAADVLEVESKINPQDIDQVRVGQEAALRFSAFSQRTTPEVNGVVSRVSADLSSDQRTGASYYTARITLPPEELARIKGLRLIPGMPLEAFVKTGDRTVLSYLTKPLTDQVMKAFREDR
jgi:HlyD family secretion protein